LEKFRQIQEMQKKTARARKARWEAMLIHPRSNKLECSRGLPAARLVSRDGQPKGRPYESLFAGKCAFGGNTHRVGGSLANRLRRFAHGPMKTIGPYKSFFNV
jgi:hypothetical protein